MRDYNLIGGYSGYKNELDIGVTYKEKGFYTVIIEKPAVVDKISTLRKMRKDFPKSDDVRFSLQDAMSELSKIDKQLMMLQ